MAGRTPPRLAIAVLALGAIGVLGAGGGLGDGEREWAPGDSVSGQASTCGSGTWYAGDSFAFSHRVWFSMAIDGDHGYVVDCYSGTDAYFEYWGSYWGDVYVYGVWGTLGSYS